MLIICSGHKNCLDKKCSCKIPHEVCKYKHHSEGCEHDNHKDGELHTYKHVTYKQGKAKWIKNESIQVLLPEQISE